MIGIIGTRIPAALACLVVLVASATGAPGVIAMDFEDEIFGSALPEVAEPPPVEGSPEWADLILRRYSEIAGWGTEYIRDGKGDPEALRLFLPSPLAPDGQGPEGQDGGTADQTDWTGPDDQTGPNSTMLPLSPPGHISRFARLPFDDTADGKIAFRLADIGWTAPAEEGARPPAIDVLFHTGILDKGDPADCPAGSVDCKPPPSDKEIAARMADRPGDCFLPDGAVPVENGAAAETGLFNLVSGPATDEIGPAILYGTFDGEVVFLGVSLNMDVLTHAVAEGHLGERLSWPVGQPARYRHAWWPGTIALDYFANENRFAVSLEDFEQHPVDASCN